MTTDTLTINNTTLSAGYASSFNETGDAAPVHRCGTDSSARIDFSTLPARRAGSPFDHLFPFLLAGMVSLGIFAGITARAVPPVRQKVAATVQKIKTEFHFSEPKKIEPPPPPVAEVKKVVPAEKEVVDLTKVEPKPSVEQQPAEPPAAEPQQVRKVFGLRRVYSTGLGAGGSMQGGIVAKIGNTINKEYDTVTATETDIRGTVVSAATVTSAPKFRKVIKPVYTKEMLERHIEGTVKVKVLVDIDGKVKKATCLNDLGFGSAREAANATLRMEFEPALRDSQPVAVWIIVPITFAILG